MDDPGAKRIISRRGSKRTERILNASKSSTSIMFSGTAAGHMMPVYTVYKSSYLYPGWLDGGEKQWRYNRTSSGWFDQVTFEDWFEKIIVPYCKNRVGKKLIIGDNLASHLSPRVVQMCLENNITFAFLP